VVLSSENPNSFQEKLSSFILWEHPSYRSFDDSVRILLLQLLEGKFFQAAGVLSMMAVHFLLSFLPGEFDIISVYNDDFVSVFKCSLRVKCWLMLAH
jgi:hypothetical protein